MRDADTTIHSDAEAAGVVGRSGESVSSSETHASVCARPLIAMMPP